MNMTLTNVYSRNYHALINPKKRIAINEGGTSSSKTFSIMQLLIILAQSRTKPMLISVVSESFPHLSLGVMRDFRLIMGDSFDESKWNATNHIYNFGAAQIEFFSVDNPGKAHGPRRDILYCNEVNNIPKIIVDALSVRTKRFEFYDFNPVSQFWCHDMQGREDVEWIHSTYLDAKHVLPNDIVLKIESRRETDPNWWNVYGLGKVGNVEGLVHPLFSQVDSLPVGGVEVYGLDFGYTNDPTALTQNRIIGDSLYSDLLIYESGLTNQQIAARMEQLGLRKGYDEIIADSAEPKSIDEIMLYGYNVMPAAKGQDSILNGIQRINQYKQYWTKRSIQAIKEMRNYRYVQDKNGKLTNKPIDGWNHALDSRRYAIMSRDQGDGCLLYTKHDALRLESTIV
jgi:phage terminase large subunit